MKTHRKVYIPVALAVLVAAVLVTFALPQSAGAVKAVGLLACCLILWISEAMPISVSTLLMLALLPLLGLMDFTAVLSNFGVNTALFIMASSGITVALSAGSIPQWLTRKIVKSSNAHPRRMVAGMALLVALFSAFVSSLATCTLFSAIVADMLKHSGIKPRQSNFGKDLMLVIPACAGIGGFMSPAGTPANILVMDLLKQHGIHITFLQWCAVGFPVGITAVLLFSLCVVLFFKPEKNLIAALPKPVSFDKKDVATAVVVAAVIAGWIVGSFVPVLNPTLVALVGLAVLFMLPLDLMDMPRFSRGVNWDLVLSMGAVSVLMTAIADTGLLSDVAKAVFSGTEGLAPWILLMLISLVICVFRAVIPTTTAVIALFAPMLLSIAAATGLNMTALLLMASFWSAAALLLVYTEPIYLISFHKGYFTQKDLIICGAVPSLLLCVVGTLEIDVLVRLLQLV